MNERSQPAQLSTEEKDRAFWREADAPAHPLNFLPGSSVWERVGLTKREVFAAMAMQAVRTVNPACTSREIAQSAVADADALLKELAK